MKTDCLSVIPMTESEVEDAAYTLTHGCLLPQLAIRLCLSHERLRIELEGLKAIYEELESENARLKAALATIADYGICAHVEEGVWQWGCDCPRIAQEAISNDTALKSRGIT